MPWWDNALYDTCSLITLDKLLLDHPELAHYSRHVVALEASFWPISCVRPRPSVCVSA